MRVLPEPLQQNPIVTLENPFFFTKNSTDDGRARAIIKKKSRVRPEIVPGTEKHWTTLLEDFEDFQSVSEPDFELDELFLHNNNGGGGVNPQQY